MNNQNQTLTISRIKELTAATSKAFLSQVRLMLTPDHKDIELNLSEMEFIDSCGLGALVGLRNIVTSRGGVVRLIKPSPGTRQLLELTRLNGLFEIVDCVAAGEKDSR
jgi:anti-anti-sigma factor